jgi:tetratricopeptide (TPR) repeat protein
MIRALALVMVLGVASAAQGQTAPLAPAPSPSRDATKEEARRHFLQGVALYEEGNFTGALAEFQAAQKLAPNASVLFNIGLTEKALYRYADASRTLERYLIEGNQGAARLTPERRQQVVQLIEEMKSLLAPLRFLLVPATARVTVDGRPMTVTADGSLALAAGNHVVDVAADGYESLRREIVVVAGVPAEHDFQLKPIARNGRVNITSSRADTRVFIDGQDRGLAPLALELPAGGHQLEARADGYEPFRSELVLAASQERSVDIEMQLPPARAGHPVYKKWWFWTGLGTAVAGGTAAAFLLKPGVKPPVGSTFMPGVFDADQ